MPHKPEDDWREIPEFPRYMINGLWEIRVVKTGQLITPHTETERFAVKLTKDGVAYHRAVRKLFYSAFPERRNK